MVCCHGSHGLLARILYRMSSVVAWSKSNSHLTWKFNLFFLFLHIIALWFPSSSLHRGWKEDSSFRSLVWGVKLLSVTLFSSLNSYFVFKNLITSAIIVIIFVEFIFLARVYESRFWSSRIALLAPSASGLLCGQQSKSRISKWLMSVECLRTEILA